MWLNLWACRLGSVDRALLEHTLRSVLGMESSDPHSKPLATIPDAQMTRLPFAGQFPRASAPLEVIHMDVFKISSKDLPTDVDGNIIGLSWALVCVDDHSRFARTYFSKRKEEVPKLIRLFFEDMGARSLFGSHLIIHGRLRQSIHTD